MRLYLKQPKQRLMLRTIYVCGMLSFGIWLTTLNPEWMQAVTVTDHDYGELYRVVKVNRFKSPLPPTPAPIKTDSSVRIADHDVFTMGDSFFWRRLGYHDFSTQLSQRLDIPIHYFGHWGFNPFHRFKAHELDDGRKKILVLGLVERDLFRAFGEPYEYDPPVSTIDRVENEHVSSLRQLRRRLFVESEERYRYFLEYNHVSFFVGSLVRSFLFEQFEKIHPFAPAYSTDPPFLFMQSTVKEGVVTSYFYHHSDSLLDVLAGNIVETRDQLLEKYDTHLIFVPVPNKVTIYSHLITEEPYDDYLPRLYERLNENGVVTVELYDKFRRENELLYYPSDSHWMQAGLSIALEDVAAKIDSILDRRSLHLTLMND